MAALYEVRIGDDQEADSDEPIIDKDNQVINDDDLIFTLSPHKRSHAHAGIASNCMHS